ncbi:unnamed protein product [Sphagnum balticum]
MREKISQMEYPSQGGLQLKKRWWTGEEDEKLKQLVEEYGARNWKRIAVPVAVAQSPQPGDTEVEVDGGGGLGDNRGAQEVRMD